MDKAVDPSGAGASKAPAIVATIHDDDVSKEFYLGVVKSYNDRRGFGFVACPDTADMYGRDVYMPKAEATMAALQAVGVATDVAAAMVASANTGAAAAAAAISGGLAAAEKEREKAASDGDKASAPRLAEEDVVLFRTRLSVEGYPQAVCVRRLRKFSGCVLRVPSSLSDGVISSEDVEHICRLDREVTFQISACGQIRFLPGDVVSFCLPEAAGGMDGFTGLLAPSDRKCFAKMLTLTKSDRPNGSVLGCFMLELPRSRSPGTEESTAEGKPNLKLPCHAFGDKLILAGLPPDLDEAELMHFFSKQAATNTIVAHARTCSFASVTFPGVSDVARFLSRTAHAFADDKDTLIARLSAMQPSIQALPTLPALPAPCLSQGTGGGGDTLEPGSLLVIWSPLVLAVAYSVELRPEGSSSLWSNVDVSSSKLGDSHNRFDSTCSSCKVTGLQCNVAYEARVLYFTECGTCSEPSEASEPCMPAASTTSKEQASPKDASACLVAAQGFVASTNPVSHSPPITFAGLGATPHTAHSSEPPPWQAWGPSDPPFGPLPFAISTSPLDGFGLPAYLPTPVNWRSPTGLVVPPPAAPEVRAADEFGFAVSVQWPAVLQASAYVVELREAGFAASERFVRSAPEAKLGTVVELRIGGLRPGPPPGRVYMAQVRTVGADGSESEPSPAGWSPHLPSTEASRASPPATDVSLLATPGQLTTISPDLYGGLSADAKPWHPGSTATEATSSLWSFPPATHADASIRSRPLPPPPPSGPPAIGLGKVPVVEKHIEQELPMINCMRAPLVPQHTIFANFCEDKDIGGECLILD